MKKNNKGISLISLVVIIVATIILIGVVVTVGYDYIQESNRTKTEAVVKFIADAASRRQNDKHIDTMMYYVGHPFNGKNIDKIMGLPNEFDENKIKPESMWYFIDANSAEQLGVTESYKYIEKDLDNPTKDIVKTVLVDYVTGEAYLVEIEQTYLKGEDSVKENSTCPESEGGHVYSIQTCTKGSFCIKCGEPNPGHDKALGHNYSEPTCTAAATCIRCKEIDLNKPATGHNFETDIRGAEIWKTDATRHWKECTVCGTKKDMDEHEKGCVRIEISSSVYDAEYHKEVCSTCGWESVKTPHKIKYEITGDNTHRRLCELCEYSEEHEDSGWIMDDEIYHWRECEDGCPFENDNLSHVDGDKIFKNTHVDQNGDSVCDTCSKIMDKQPPNSFVSAGSYARLEEATTSTLKLTAYTQDALGMMGYKFGIDENKDGVIDWSLVPLVEVEDDVACEKTFYNLEANKSYDIYVIGIDNGNNPTPQYRIPNTKTEKIPEVQVIGIPNGYVSNEFTLTFKTNSTLPNIKIEYSIDGGTTWTEGTSLTIDKETIDLKVRAKDTRSPEPNIGNETQKDITNFDKTSPTVTIATKTGDDANTLQTSHTAVVTIEDEKVGIAAGTKIRYAWSLSNTTPPTTYTEATTTNTELQKNVSVEIKTPTGVAGEYYLWIDKGIEDSLKNKTTQTVCSTFTFNIDDEEIVLSNIKMYNPNPEVENQSGYVKTNGTVNVTFTSNKALAKAPTISVGGINVTNITSTDKINWTASIVATTAMPEGSLTLKISGLETVAGKTSSNEYTDANLTGNRVVYDKTTPTLEYVEK
ncbi:MAG: hypothetical protein J6B87_03465 [Clostridia bacterium]|nr:hypothetical protein [Clostridia bacterium]